MTFISSTYPEALLSQQKGTLPPLIRQFTSDSEINSHIRSKTYGKPGIENQPIGGGIVITSTSSSSFTYSIRMNSTFFADISEPVRPNTKTMPDTRVLFDPLATNAQNKDSCSIENGGPKLRKINSGEGGQCSCYGEYMLNGAVTMQRLVDDFIIHEQVRA